MLRGEEIQKFNKSAERYVKKVSVNPEMSHNKLLSRIRKNSKVLEFGPASGAMTRVLYEDMGCKVSIVEIDRACYENVMQYAESGVCADIEQLEWEKEFENQVFDYIIFADVLEHLRDPGKILQEVQKFLKQDGSILISVPNIAHNSIIIQLLNNKFIYQSTGILDYTHVRHFTFSEIEKLCISAGFGVVYMDAVYIAVGKNEFDVSYVDVDPYLADVLKKRPLGEVYQHILEVKKKEYVEKESIEIENCLGTQKDYSKLMWKEQEAQKSEDSTANQKVVDLLCQNPNFYFGTNNEIARLRLEINEIYQAEENLKDVVELQKRIQEYQEETRAKNNHIHKLLEEEERKDKRIVELQNEEQKRNEHIAALDSQVNQKDAILIQYTSEIEEMQSQITAQTEQLTESQNQLAESRKQLTEKQKQLADLQNQVLNIKNCEIELTQIVRNKEGHIEQLLEVEREYEREKNSKTFRMALKFRKISTAILPVNSKRRFFVKAMVKAICHPLLAIKMINLKRIKNCFIILKTEGVESAQNHYRLVEEYEKSRTVPLNNESLDIEKVSKTTKSFGEYEKLHFTVSDAPQVSIVIPVYNQFDYTYHCLESILKNSGECTYEIIIANDCSTDLTQRIEEIVEGITVINNEINLRFLLNCNNAAKHAKGKYILFLNNDTQVLENWLQPLVDLIESDSKIGMVGSKLIYSDGYLQEAGGILWKDASAWNYGNRQNPNDSEFNYVHEVDYISGAAIMIRSDLWKEIGGFDTRFAPAYCEDSDLAFEVRKHGYKVVYQPLSVVVHFEGVSNGTDLEQGQKKYQVENQKKFYEKWKLELEVSHYENGTDVFLARDRGRERKHVLVIDHYVPQYDKDAGSKTTFMYLKMLVKKGYHITFLGDNFYQHEPYATELQQMGIYVLYGPKYAEHWREWLLENISYFDIFYLNRPHITIKYINLINQHASGKIIYYGHDLHFLRTRREYELNGNKELLEESAEWLEKEMYIMHRTDMNYFPSEAECREIHKLDPAIPVKAITAYVYEEFFDAKYDAESREGLLFVGGFGHGPNVDAVKWFLAKIYPDVYQRIHANFYIVGSRAPEEITQIQSDGVVVKGFVSEEELQRLYASCRIAVVPLRYGAGVKGKVVEALYYGIPVVTTTVGAEGIPGIEEVVSIQDSEDEIINAICSLYESVEKLSDMSRLSGKFVEAKFSTDAVWDIIKEDFR